MSLRLLHCSDTHGVLYPLRATRVAAIVHSGDLFPTIGISASVRDRKEARSQEQWIALNAERLERWTQGLPFLYCTGNHDYTDGEQQLRDAGINATCLNDRIVTFADLTVYGFPWTKFFTGCWNRELRSPEMSVRIAAIPVVDVLVSHGPMAGILDVNSYGEHCGCPQMERGIRWGAGVTPKAYLHGHIHESHGTASYGGMIVSNAATTQHILEI